MEFLSRLGGVQMDKLSRRIKIRRTELGLTQNEVAKEIGVPQPTFSRYESGKRRITIDVAKRLIPVLKIEPDFFFNDYYQLTV